MPCVISCLLQSLITGFEGDRALYAEFEHSLVGSKCSPQAGRLGDMLIAGIQITSPWEREDVKAQRKSEFCCSSISQSLYNVSCNASRRWENAGKGRGREGSKRTRLQNSLSRAFSCSMGLILALLSLGLHRAALRASPRLREVHLSRWGCQVCLSDLVECWLRHKHPAPKSHMFLDTCLVQKDILCKSN